MYYIISDDMEMFGALHSRFFLFFCACVSGILFALVWRKYEQTVQLSLIHNHYSAALKDTNYADWLKKRGQIVKPSIEEDIHYRKHQGLELESAYLYREVPILCLVLVNSHRGAEAVKNTWAKHCNFVALFGKFVDDKIPVLKIPTSTSFQGFCYAFVHVYKKYSGKFHWVFIADDTTYALIENMRYYVAPLNSSMHYYLGYPVKDFSNLYNIGTAGIVMSYGCMSLLSSIYKSAHDCTAFKSPSWYFDQALGKIFSSFNVHPIDTRDNQLRTRFNPFAVDTMLIPGSISVFSSYWRTSVYLSEEGMNCCSDNAITFHDNSPSKMYLLEYMLYHLSVFRNSFSGLGNFPPGEKAQNKMNNTLKKVSAEQIGEPHVQLIESSRSSKKSSKHQFYSKGKLESILNDIFGDMKILLGIFIY